jgi:hypothetical protein
MTYNKPEVAVLGDARELIESINGKVSQQLDSSSPKSTPAYDLDE